MPSLRLHLVMNHLTNKSRRHQMKNRGEHVRYHFDLVKEHCRYQNLLFVLLMKVEPLKGFYLPKYICGNQKYVSWNQRKEKIS